MTKVITKIEVKEVDSDSWIDAMSTDAMSVDQIMYVLKMIDQDELNKLQAAMYQHLTSQRCPACHEEALEEGQFLCRFCMRKVSDKLRKKLRLAGPKSNTWNRAVKESIAYVKNHQHEPTKTHRF